METQDIKIAVLQTKVDNIQETTERIEKKLDDFLNNAPNMFAGKWVENLFKTLVVVTLVAVVGGILALLGLHVV